METAGSEGADNLPSVENPAVVVLVEGVSDQAAVESLAYRFGRDFKAERVSVVPMGGASPIGDYLDDLLGSGSSDLRLAGLCDEAEEGEFRSALESSGFGSNLTRADMESLGFFVCVTDLEDEMIRSLGVASVLEVVDLAGEMGPFRRFQNQPQWRERPANDQLRRFMGTKSGRKHRYGRLLAEALDLTRVPAPLEGLLTYI